VGGQCAGDARPLPLADDGRANGLLQPLHRQAAGAQQQGTGIHQGEDSGLQPQAAGTAVQDQVHRRPQLVGYVRRAGGGDPAEAIGRWCGQSPGGSVFLDHQDAQIF
jgi:hypothetical protein